MYWPGKAASGRRKGYHPQRLHQAEHCQAKIERIGERVQHSLIIVQKMPRRQEEQSWLSLWGMIPLPLPAIFSPAWELLWSGS